MPCWSLDSTCVLEAISVEELWCGLSSPTNMKVAFCLFFTLALFFLYSDAIEETEQQVDCTGFPRKACTKEFMPHCASDGVTYPNRCNFCNALIESRGILTLNYYGKCKK